MPWDYEIVADAWASLRTLEPLVQEALLDELEDLCETGGEEMFAPFDGEVGLEVYPVVDGELHRLALDLLANPRLKRLLLLDVQEL